MRRQSVAFFLGDVGFLSDPKFRALARRLPDPDDFNSAVGAFFIALAAARRNGLPEIDVDTETDSRFVADLRAVGLLAGAGFPEKAFKGWAPSRRPRPSEAASSDAEVRRDAPSVSNGDENAGSAVSSTPLPSTPIESVEGGAGGDPPLTQVVDYIEDRSGRPWHSRPGSKVWDTLTADIADFGADRIIAEMTVLTGHRPDHGQLVFGASRRLHPIEGTPTAKPSRGGHGNAEEAERAFNR